MMEAPTGPGPAVLTPRVCIVCGANGLRKSHTRFYERVSRFFSARVPFRCRTCGERRWYKVPEAAHSRQSLYKVLSHLMGSIKGRVF